MSVSIQTVEFERRDAYLSELDEGPPYTVNGVALGADDVTVGQSGVKKLWPADELEKAAESLQGTNLVVDHNNDSSGVVGRVTKAGYKDSVGVIYQAELFNDELAEKISNGLLEVSIRGEHVDVEEMEETEEGAKIVKDIVFDNLSIVPTGAAPSNTIEMGETEELSVAELAAFTDSLEYAELAEIEPGMWVQGDGMKGVTVSTIEDGEIEVDIYEESDGKWRSTGETEMVSTDALDEWDVDEDDIDSMDEEEMYGVSSVPDALRFSSEEDAMELVEQEDGLTGVHEMDGEYVPGSDHDEFLEWMRNKDTDQMASTGDKVEWESSGGMAQGVIVDRKTDGCFSERIDGDMEVCADDDDPVALIEIVTDGERTGTMVAHKESTISAADFEMSKHKMDPDVEDDKESEQVDPPEFEEGMMVQWAVNPDMFGEIVHNPDDADIIMVEVMEMMDGEMKPTGHTLTAAPPDLEPMDREEMSEKEDLETFSDYPEAAKENAQMALDAREETDNPNDCGTDVGWRRANQLADGEPLSEDVVARMAAFNRHRSNKDQGDEGKENCGWMMWKAWGGDEGVDWAMDKMDSMEEAEELQEIEVHSVDYSGTTDASWEKPAMEDFDTDDLSEIDDHFLVSKTGFPPKNFTDLALPVVEPSGELNINALRNAKARGGQVSGLSGEDLDRAMSMINSMAEEEFDDSDFEEAAYARRPRTMDDTGHEKDVQNSSPIDITLELLDKYMSIDRTNERDSVDQMLSWLLGATEIPMETLSDLRMVARRFIEETPETDSFDAMTVEQFRGWLLMNKTQRQRGGMTRGVPSSVQVLTGDDLRHKNNKSEESELDDTTKVINMTEDIEQKLAELSEPVAVEQDDLEELQAKADRFEEMSDTLSALKERTDVLDDVDREKVEELAEADEPVVVESARMESLEAEAEQVAATYAAELSEASNGFLSTEELTDKLTIEELREKYEEQIGDPAEELASGKEADPQSGDPSEEELEERAGEGSEEELSSESDEAAAKREELRNRIFG